MEKKVTLTNAQIRKIKMNKRLVYYVIKRNDYEQKDEYVSAGFYGLLKATQTFNESRGNFSTYATMCIKNEILMEIRKENRRKVELSLQQTVIKSDENGKEITYMDVLTSKENFEKKYENLTMIREAIYYLLNYLLYIDKKIILLAMQGHSNVEISRVLQVSPAHICRLRKIAVQKLKKYVSLHPTYANTFKVEIENEKLIVTKDNAKIIADIEEVDIATKLLEII